MKRIKAEDVVSIEEDGSVIIDEAAIMRPFAEEMELNLNGGSIIVDFKKRPADHHMDESFGQFKIKTRPEKVLHMKSSDDFRKISDFFLEVADAVASGYDM